MMSEVKKTAIDQIVDIIKPFIPENGLYDPNKILNEVRSQLEKIAFAKRKIFFSKQFDDQVSTLPTNLAQVVKNYKDNLVHEAANREFATLDAHIGFMGEDHDRVCLIHLSATTHKPETKTD